MGTQIPYLKGAYCRAPGWRDGGPGWRDGGPGWRDGGPGAGLQRLRGLGGAGGAEGHLAPGSGGSLVPKAARMKPTGMSNIRHQFFISGASRQSSSWVRVWLGWGSQGRAHTPLLLLMASLRTLLPPKINQQWAGGFPHTLLPQNYLQEAKCFIILFYDFLLAEKVSSSNFPFSPYFIPTSQERGDTSTRDLRVRPRLSPARGTNPRHPVTTRTARLLRHLRPHARARAAKRGTYF